MITRPAEYGKTCLVDLPATAMDRRRWCKSVPRLVRFAIKNGLVP